MLTGRVLAWYLLGTRSVTTEFSRRRERENNLGNQQTQNNQTAGPKDFHVHLMHGTADWLRSKVNRDQPSVPAVIRKIIEEAERQDKQKGRR